MESRERVLRTLAFKETDRVPFDISGRENDLSHFLGINNIEEMRKTIGIDFRHIPVSDLKDSRGLKRFHKGHEANVWGVPFICGSNNNQELCPLYEVSSVDEVEAYEWPSVENINIYDIDKLLTENEGYFLSAYIWAPIFHDFTWLCGYENCLALFLTEPEIAKAVLRRSTDFWIGLTKKVLEMGGGRFDCALNCNDFGTQRGLLMSPDIWRAFIKPELKRFYDCIKYYEVKVYQHSCGSIAEIIPDLIEIGADILDPVQVAADGMDVTDLAEKFGGKIAFHGGIDTQYVLPFYSEEEVRAEVRKVIAALGSKGGYILCGSQEYMDDIPIENIAAVYDEAKKIKISL